jgi:hypothetical protein
MAGKNTAVFGIYPNRTSAENAVDALKAADFRNSDISVLLPEGAGTKDFAHEKNTKAPEGATTGAGTGALLGGGLGWLLGIGALAIPGLGPFIAAGPIMAALAGAGVGGAVGGLTGALIGMGIPEYEAKRCRWNLWLSRKCLAAPTRNPHRPARHHLRRGGLPSRPDGQQTDQGRIRV